MDANASARLKRNLIAATDEALVALANRGLVRRATKDLEQAEPFTFDETEEAVLVQGAGWTVTMPAEGPVAATDDTPATGITRQIVAATMFLRDHWAREESVDGGRVDALVGTPEVPKKADLDIHDPPVDDAPDESIKEAVERLIDAPTDGLFKWSGKTPLLEASASFASVGAAIVSLAPQLSVEFREAGIRVMMMTDRPARTLHRLLDQFKSTADKADHPRWVMLAVLALKRSAGKETTIVNDPGATLSDAIRYDRQRIARQSLHLLRTIAASGLAQPSSRVVERLRIAGVAAEAARFPRLARHLSSIADDAQLQIARDAAADLSRMRHRMLVTHALAEAASRESNARRVDLFGRPRTTYTLVGELDLCGLGAYGWRTASGFEGLTAIFWDTREQRFLTASVSRGEGQDRTFSIARAYEGGIGWSGGGGIETLCRSKLSMSDAKINPDGRLSVSETCRVVIDKPTDPTALDFGRHAVSQWSVLIEIARRSQPIGLRRPDPRASFVVIQPSQWGLRWFDELEQAFVWQLHDQEGDVVEVRLPWTDVDEASVAFLESLKVERDHPTGILGRLEVGAGAIRIYPISIFSSGTARGDWILCPQFDQTRIRSRNDALLQRLRKKFKRERRVETRIGDAPDEELADPMASQETNVPPLLRGLTVDIDNILNSALETGSGRFNPAARQTLIDSRDRLASLGVKPLADALSTVLETEDMAPPDLLHAAYRLLLFRQSLGLSLLS